MESLFKQYEGVFDNKVDNPEKTKKTEGYAYSPFALQDAIGEANIKNIWIEYQKIKMLGIEPEEIIHKIISKIRDMLAISKGATIASLSIKDFPYNKSKKDLKNWKIEKLEDFYTKLVSIYHESRMGGETLETALEKLLLKL